MPKANPTDPMAAVQNAMADAVAATRAQQDAYLKATQAELDNLRKSAMESLEAATDAQHKSLDATVTAAKSVVDGLDQVAALGQGLVKNAAGAPAAQFKKVLAARTPADAVTAQVELVQASQKQAADYANKVGQLLQDVAKDVMKPVQVLVAANLDHLGKAVAR